jgi:hypothetical protein
MGNRFEQALVDQVEALFEEQRAIVCETIGAPDWKRVILSAPFVEIHYAMFDDELIAELKDLICNALATQARFHASKPSWAPDLPLSLNAGRELKRKRDPRVRLVGYYGISQLVAKYDESHPAFEPFCRGLMADARTPKNLREDPDLQRLFPPKRLGLAPGGLAPSGLAQGGYWYTLETLKSWCDLMARVGASILRKLDDPSRQAMVASRLFQQALAPELREMFS